MFLIGSDAATVVDSTLKTASSLGSDIFISTLVIISVMILAVLYIWKIAIPRQRVDAELAQKLGETTAAIGRIAADTYSIVKNNSSNLDLIANVLIHHTSCNEDILDIIAKLAKYANLDIAKELGVIQGKISVLNISAKSYIGSGC